jgi:hypothetical protein
MSRARPVIGPGVERAMAWTWFRCVQLQRFWNYPLTRRRAAIQRRLAAMKAKVRNLAGGDQVQAAQAVVDWAGIPIFGISLKDARTSRYAAAMSTYLPKRLSVRVIYVKVDFDIGKWRRLSPDLEVVKSPGTHEIPDIANVAEHLRVRLQSRE